MRAIYDRCTMRVYIAGSGAEGIGRMCASAIAYPEEVPTAIDPIRRDAKLQRLRVLLEEDRMK